MLLITLPRPIAKTPGLAPASTLPPCTTYKGFPTQGCFKFMKNSVFMCTVTSSHFPQPCRSRLMWRLVTSVMPGDNTHVWLAPGNASHWVVTAGLTYPPPPPRLSSYDSTLLCGGRRVLPAPRSETCSATGTTDTKVREQPAQTPGGLTNICLMNWHLYTRRIWSSRQGWQ